VQTQDELSIPMHEVDTHNAVPVWEASDKKETGARTIRKKIHTKLPIYLEVFLLLSLSPSDGDSNYPTLTVPLTM